jgi:hypothetical protein
MSKTAKFGKKTQGILGVKCNGKHVYGLNWILANKIENFKI